MVLYGLQPFALYPGICMLSQTPVKCLESREGPSDLFTGALRTLLVLL